MSYNVELIIILVASGTFGGIVSFFTNKAEEETMSKNTEIVRSIIIGIAASLLVPLFLNTISSSLITDSKTDDSKVFIIIGFCLVASISSKAFIQVMTNKVLKELNELKENVKYIKKDVNEIVASETESEPLEEAILNLTFDENEEDYEILKALSDSKYVYRALSGLSKETKISKETVNGILTKLVQRELVEQTTKAKGIRFVITNKGRQALMNKVFKEK